MSKLNKAYNELLDLKEKWCYLLKESEKINKEEYKHLSQDEEIGMALRHLNKLSRDEELYQEALTREKNEIIYRLDRRGLLDEGMQKGMQQVALNMLDKNLKISLISEITGLSEHEISKIKK